MEDIINKINKIKEELLNEESKKTDVNEIEKIFNQNKIKSIENTANKCIIFLKKNNTIESLINYTSKIINELGEERIKRLNIEKRGEISGSILFYQELYNLLLEHQSIAASKIIK
jgi:hypothetical protein